MQFEDLKDPALQERLRACQSAEELAAIAAEMGIELSDEELEAVSGGVDWSCALHDSTCDGYRFCQKKTF